MSEEDVPSAQDSSTKIESGNEMEKAENNCTEFKKSIEEKLSMEKENKESEVSTATKDDEIKDTKLEKEAPQAIVESVDSLKEIESIEKTHTDINGKNKKDADLKLDSSCEDVMEVDASETPINQSSTSESRSENLNSSATDTPSGRGRRERKKVEKFVQEVKKEEVKVENVGRGTPLKDIPYINFMINKINADELVKLHRVAYNRPGSKFDIKKNLRKFQGYFFKEGDPEYKKKSEYLEKLFVADLKKMLKIVGLETSGSKQELKDKLFKFLLYPEDHGASLPSGKRKSKLKAGKKKVSKVKKAKSEGGKAKKVKEVKKEEDAESSSSEDEDEEEEEQQQQEALDSDSAAEEEESSKIKAPSSKKALKKAAPKKTPKSPAPKKTPKSPAPKKTPKSPAPKKTPKRPAPSNDEVPLAKKAKKIPNDTEIKAFIKKILDEANLEEVTMKKLCQQVYDNYPSHDLSHKKDFIKSTVKSILS